MDLFADAITRQGDVIREGIQYNDTTLLLLLSLLITTTTCIIIIIITTTYILLLLLLVLLLSFCISITITIVCLFILY